MAVIHSAEAMYKQLCKLFVQ